MRFAPIATSASLLIMPLFAEPVPNPLLTSWKEAKVAPVCPERERHTIHSYFNVCPESPDGRWILFFSSTTTDAHLGDVVIRERATGKETVLAKDVEVEDAHRTACQQWVCGGEEVVYHDFKEGEWIVVAVNVATQQARTLARGRQVCWGQPLGDVVPLYGPHSNPGEHRSLEILNVREGTIRTIFSGEEVRQAFPEQVANKYGDRPLSIFFPILSPDLKRVIFKLATPAGGEFRSKNASLRHFLLAYDLEEKKFLFLNPQWGHPAWHPDSRTLINTPNVLVNTDDGSQTSLPELPNFPGAHPSVSPDATFFLTDTKTTPFGGEKGEWGVVVGDLKGTHFEFIHRFDHRAGAASWRPSHPHPVFNADGSRIYFNVNTGGWTRLHVAEKNPTR